MRLTKAILDAIIEMSARVEAGTVEDYRGYNAPEDQIAYRYACKVGDWARWKLRQREARKSKAARS